MSREECDTYIIRERGGGFTINGNVPAIKTHWPAVTFKDLDDAILAVRIAFDAFDVGKEAVRADFRRLVGIRE